MAQRRPIEVFLSAGRLGQGGWWRPVAVLTAVVVIFCSVLQVATILAVALSRPSSVAEPGLPPDLNTPEGLKLVAGMKWVVAHLLDLSAFAEGLALLALVAGVAWLHRRPPGTLLGDGRAFSASLAAALAAFAGLLAWTFLGDGGTLERSSATADWLLRLPKVIVIAGVIAAAEEIVFRAYLWQCLDSALARCGVADGAGRTLTGGAVVAAAFVAAHLHSDLKGGFYMAYVAGIGVFSVYLTFLVWQTGGVAASIALHWVNDIVALGVVTSDLSPLFHGNGLYHLRVSQDVVDVFLGLAILFAIIISVHHLVLGRIGRWAPR